MSSSSPEQNPNKPATDPEEQGNCPQRAFAEAEVLQGAPVSIIPVAPLHWRLLAFLLDGALIGLFAFFLLTRVLLPEYHPVAYSQWMELRYEKSVALTNALENNEPLPRFFDPELLEKMQTDEMVAMSIYMREILALCLFLYFVLCERFMGGGSLGKSMLRLRVISLSTGRPPTIWESCLRGLIKVCPIMNELFIVSYLLVFGNRMRRSGHDLLARTIVVSDTGGYVPSITPQRTRDEDDED